MGHAMESPDPNNSLQLFLLHGYRWETVRHSESPFSPIVQQMSIVAKKFFETRQSCYATYSFFC